MASHTGQTHEAEDIQEAMATDTPAATHTASEAAEAAEVACAEDGDDAYYLTPLP